MEESDLQIILKVKRVKISKEPVYRIDFKLGGLDTWGGLIATIRQWHLAGEPEIKKYDAVIFSDPNVQKTFTCREDAEQEVINVLKLHKSGSVVEEIS